MDQRRAGALHAQLSPQAHFGPQVQGRHAQFLLEHGFVISSFLSSPVIRTIEE